MATPSSLLKSAASAAQKQRDYEDALAAYEWDNSTKSYADFVAYDAYLNDRQTRAGSPGDQLTYQKKRDSAQSAYISNEIQRQSINVIEGSGTNIDKYNRMLGLYHTAADSGQNDLAQSLRLQLDNLSVTIQNEQKANLGANKEASAEATKMIDAQVKDAVAQIQDNAKYALEKYQELGPAKFQEATGSDIFSLLSNMVNSQDPNNPGLVQIYDQASKITPDTTKQREYQSLFNGIANGEKVGIKLPGLGDVSYKDLADQAYAQSIGQTLFDTVQTANGVEFTRNQATGYAWGRDESGNYKLMPIYNPKQDFTSGISNPKKKGEQLSYNTLLQNAGFDIVKNSNGELVVRNNGEFDSAGIPRGQQLQLYVDAQGNLQAINGNNAYSLGFDQKSGSYTGLNAQGPNPINLLPSGNERTSRFNNRFFAGQDLSSLPAGAIGLVDTTSPIARSMEAGPLAKPQPSLQGLPTPIPQPQAPTSVQSGAVSPIGLPGNITINLAQPKPLPQIVVAKPKPLPNLTVKQAVPQQGLTVAAPAQTPKITF